MNKQKKQFPQFFLKYFILTQGIFLISCLKQFLKE